MSEHVVLSITDDKPLQEKCGLVAVYTPTLRRQLPLALIAAVGVQHRGQQGAGAAIQTRKGIKKHTGNGLLRQVFTSSVIRKLNKPTRWTLVHCRYGTHGGYNKQNLQPCVVKTKDGDFVAVIHNGEFTGTGTMRSQLKGNLSEDASDTYIFTKLLRQAVGKNWDEKILKIITAMTGSFSLIISVGDSLYVARDTDGIRPLFIGQLKRGGWLVASETHAFTKIGAIVNREIKRGEIIRINLQGIHFIHKGETGGSHFCDFEWAYFARPDSLFPVYNDKNDGGDPSKWLSVTAFRERCGGIMALENPLKKVTFVVGIPNSGIDLGTGYANALKLPYRQMIIRDQFDLNGLQRLFMRDDEIKKIKTKVGGKLSLIPDRAIWNDAVVVFCDDSIVRGNVSQKITRAAFYLGAREVHWIVGFPPVRFPCHLGVSMRTGEELVAARFKGDTKKIARAIGATSVTYISPRGFLKARRGDKQMLNPHDERELFLYNLGCGGCVTGIYPVNKDGSHYQKSLN